jgi:DNA-binding transcriptional LysR family regulator
MEIVVRAKRESLPWNDSLLGMTVFTRVIDVGSLSAASREMNMSLAVVSKRLARLGKRLGIRLVNRTTRHLALTITVPSEY